MTRQIKVLIERIGPLWIKGEVSNLKYSNSGHIYLTLKDNDNQIAAVIWRNVASTLPFDLSDGMAALVLGSPTLYGPQGRYQIVISSIEPQGLGAMQLALSKLKKKLAREGLFDSARKKRVPMLPKKIGIVTSPKGAAIQDILNVIDRRFPRFSVLIYPTRVQGKGSADEISQGISLFNSYPQYGVEVIIIGRGGGSIEDLWAFNEEIVARSIAASKIPIISAVGHEIDVTISDLVSDKRALTPTEAAEIAVPRLDKLYEQLEKESSLLKLRVMHRISKSRARLDKLSAHCVLTRPLDKIRDKEKTLDYMSHRFSNFCSRRFHSSYFTLARLSNKLSMLSPSDYLRRVKERLSGLINRQEIALTTYMEKERTKLAFLASRLEALSPLQVLRRGYSITQRAETGDVIHNCAELSPGDIIRTRLSQGWILSKVEKTWAGWY